MGAQAGVVAVDVDGPAGDKALEGICGNPPTATNLTGKGRHLLFTHPGQPVSPKVGLAPSLDIRGDGSYIVAPPSLHRLGHRYQWDREHGLGPRECEPAPLPMQLLSLLTAPTIGFTGKPARDIPAMEQIPDGERNATLTQYAGRLLAKGHDAAETFDLVMALNEAKARPPLGREEVRRIVESIGSREARKPRRVTETGRGLTVAGEGDDAAPDDLPLPLDLATGQAEGALAFGRMDTSDAPVWPWPDLHELLGPMLPGDFQVVGALTGNGKTSFLLSLMNRLAAQNIPMLYLPLEVNPETLRRRWAAWAEGLEWDHVARNHWHHLPPGAQERHETRVKAQALLRHVQFPPDTKLSLPRLDRWVRWGIKEIGVRVVLIDHIHRMDVGGQADGYRVQLTNALRSLKDLGREHGVSTVAAAQLNRNGDLFDRYEPPVLSRLKESAAAAEEADVVLMLSRKLRQVVSRDDVEAVKAGLREVRDLEEANTMVVTCRKHRLVDAARDRHVRLTVQNGRVESLYYGGISDRV